MRRRTPKAIANDIRNNANAYYDREIDRETFDAKAFALWDEANLYKPLCIAGTPQARFSAKVHDALRRMY